MVLVRDVFGIEPDANGVFVILHGDEFGVALRGQCVKRGYEVQFIFAGGEEGIDHLHGDFDFDFGFFGILLVEYMNDQVVVLLGDADIAIVALDGDELAVLAGADGIDEGAKVDVIDVSVVDPDLAGVEAILVDGGENFFGQFEGNVDADGLALSI